MIQDDVTKLLNGELDEKGMTELTSKLSEEGKKALSEAIGLRKERTSVQTATEAEKQKLEQVQKELKDAEEKLNSTKQSTNQFREEQIGKAKVKFFEDFKVPPEKQAEYESTFKGIDSGKIDPELIYKDFVKVHGALNAEDLLKSQKSQEEMKRQADEETARAAGAFPANPPSKEPQKFSDEAVKLAKDANITPEAAERQIKGGMKRSYDI